MKIKNIILLILTTCIFNVSCKQKELHPPNVLFISIDDLNDWEGAMGGNPQAITPNMDQLFW